jgi:hypothetical protein
MDQSQTIFLLFLCIVPVEWDYHGTGFKLDFNVGINAVSQKEEDWMLSPEISWYVTHNNSTEKDDEGSPNIRTKTESVYFNFQ